MSLFQAQGLVKRFGGLVATDNVSIAVEPGEIHALIGPNGAGKSTLVNLISGLLPLDAGRLELDGVELTALPPHQRVRAGLSRCFQVTSVFRGDSVRSNLLLAAQAHAGSSFRFLSRRAGEQALMETALGLAEKVGLSDVLDRTAGTLPHGVQRKLDVALALAARPKLLLLDEPMAGMGPEDSLQMVALIEKLRAEAAILLIEHDMDAVFQLADRISVLVYGKVLTSGDAEHVKGHPEVQAVYLGTEATA
ncbi:ATP-binding cassette domain-containing protein [Azoarcus indigens]|uniref:Amino acid/amide ABC transporter ATP-binding protein 1 (HAAT family) n=1 Tax=Azoarcus indigens TaxID=29545 RepID=A0A4R6E167_9RHOO|nr:ABC transporter ATP-binding protein [Azoarcus indigens]NMG67764.1 ATP-binding cassette domain-containing protein [Azoarcus indigens]TDN51460.1 amino acid/amide ABC transporter ATP-binding protein 1 (HAAT family) [Azoarcus indigens]